MCESRFNYRRILTEAWSERRSRNPHYSLRAYARDLGIAPSNLSAIFHEKKGLGPATAVSVARRLQFSKNERAIFLASVDAEHSRSKAGRKKAKASLSRLKALRPNISADALELVGNWHSLAILEFLRLPSQDQTPSMISKRLGISEEETRATISSLLNLGIVKQSGDRLKVQKEFHWAGDEVPSSIVRKAHDQVLTKARDALSNQDFNERDFSFIMMTFDRRKLVEAKNDLREFAKAFSEKYSTESGADAVYSLGFQLFNITPFLPAKDSPR